MLKLVKWQPWLLGLWMLQDTFQPNRDSSSTHAGESGLRMRVALLASGVLCLLCHTMLTCAPENYTLYVERRGCSHCVAINTTICSGFCYSQDTNIRGHTSKRLQQQQVCMYQTLAYLTVVLPGCRRGVNPLHFYPKALRCHCSHCNSSNNECVSKDRGFPPACSVSPWHSRRGSKRRHGRLAP